MSEEITVGDLVRVNFNNAQFTLGKLMTVLYKPCATGDSWIFRDELSDPPNKTIHYVSEGCTITKLPPTEPK